jgi:hypothetical protein
MPAFTNAINKVLQHLGFGRPLPSRRTPDRDRGAPRSRSPDKQDRADRRAGIGVETSRQDRTGRGP